VNSSANPALPLAPVTTQSAQLRLGRDFTGGVRPGMLVIAAFMLAAGVLAVATRGVPTAAPGRTEPSRAETGEAR
jgi:hypothetical protein